jgi:phosphate uptake regulator
MFDMGRDFGYRRVQSTGRKSYIISLPKDWVENLGLEKGNEIAFKMLEDSSLILTPRKVLEGKKEKNERKEYWIYVDPHDSPESLCRKITSLYVISADIIHINFKDANTSSEYKNAIHELIKNDLLGSEIIEETDRGITIHILINHPEFPVEKAIRRMAVLALYANKEAVSNLGKINNETIKSIVDACNDVNRLSLYVTRQLKFGLERNLYKEWGFRTAKEFLGYRIVVNDIKSIADNAISIVNNLMTLKKLFETETLFLKEPIDEEVYSQLLEFNNMTHQLLEESLKALFKRDYEHADRVISDIKSIRAKENDLTVLISSKKMDPIFSSLFSLILDNSRRVADYSRNIAEVTLNRTVEDISIHYLSRVSEGERKS